MFSGLIETVGAVRTVRPSGGGMRLQVTCALRGEPWSRGESVAVDGACLTVIESDGRSFVADVSPETVSRTTIGRLRAGSRVNLERALRLTDRLGGHLVLGHVDATVALGGVRQTQGFRTLRVGLPERLEREVAEKGSVALDGVSLTVASTGRGWFEVAVIPATLEATTLGDRRVGDSLNLETDVLAKYVRRVMDGGGQPAGRLLAGWGDAED